MKESDIEKFKDQFEKDYNGTEFNIEEFDVIPDLDELSKGTGALVHDVSYLFFDIRGFTTWADEKWDRTVFKVLDPTFRLLTRVARLYNGFIEKLTGDGLMVAIGAEEPRAELVAVDALQCAQDFAIAMDEIVSPFMKSRKYIEEKFRWGIGVEMGQSLIAKMGIRNHFHYNSISTAANHASKLEDSAPPDVILVGDNLYSSLPEELHNQLQYWGAVHEEDAYIFELQRDEEGNWIDLLSVAVGIFGMAWFGKKVYDSLRGDKNLKVNPRGTLSSRSGKTIKKHRWYGRNE